LRLIFQLFKFQPIRDIIVPYDLSTSPTRPSIRWSKIKRPKAVRYKRTISWVVDV